MRHTESLRPPRLFVIGVERGYPDEFDLVGNRGSVQSQLGNSVPPPLAHAVAFATRSY